MPAAGGPAARPAPPPPAPRHPREGNYIPPFSVIRPLICVRRVETHAHALRSKRVVLDSPCSVRLPGPWTAQGSPDYWPDSSIYSYENISVIGLDIWQVRAGTIFDNFLITDDEVYAEDFGDETWGETKGPEEEMNLKQTEEEQERERVMEEKYFEERFKKKLERSSSGKDGAVGQTADKEEF
ncbi:hypothetical protein AV530_006858 [Patagioenas fasciata monilis]|uniref:Calreticulin n=1 Tax=Patagioenas fasciata monilis TaxID=372326 RepID=A0A1V4KQQ0_PATFA|nr:hypothetical protein AV530_006858 [Patagioenas fasciata monilis]